MSVHFVFVRYVTVVSSNEFISSDKTSSYWETMTVGWRMGARSRVRTFGSLDKVESYLSKLYAHGWIDDKERNAAKAKLNLVISRAFPPVTLEA